MNTDSIGDYILFRNFLCSLKKSKAYHGYKITLLGCEKYKSFATYLDNDIIDHFLWVPNRPQNKRILELEYLRRDLHHNQGMKYFYDTVLFSSFNSTPKKHAHEYLLSAVRSNHSIINCDTRSVRNCNDMLRYTYVHVDRNAHELFDFNINKNFFSALTKDPLSLNHPIIEDNKLNLNIDLLKNRTREYIVVNPCAYDGYRMWHKRNWAELIRYLKNNKGYDIVIACGQSEQEYCQSVIKLADVPADIYAGLPVEKLLAVLKLAKMYIGQDSGVFHIAAALNIRALCLSAGNAYFRFMNYPKNRPHIRILFPTGAEEWILKHKETSPAMVGDVHRFYINALTVAQVTSAVDELLALKDIIFIHKLKTQNTGDKEICPYHYFSDYFDQFVVQKIDNDYMSVLGFKKAVFILGGGGLINQNNDWNNAINQLAEHNPVIGWGIGFNQHNGKKIDVNINLNKLALLGLRDFNKGYPWLPCVSALKKELDTKTKIKRNIGCIIHYENTDLKFDYPTIYNNIPFADIMRFIAESNVIITNTYHMIYWTTLMGKKAILFHPFSDKFNHIKFKPTKYSTHIENDIKRAKTYPDALKECRQLNLEFFEKVKNIIENYNE